MSMKIRPEYVSPLTMLTDKRAVQRQEQPAVRQTDKVSELQTKRQQLQNQVLLMKASGTDSAGAVAETQKVLEAELEKVSAELRTAKAGTSRTAEQTDSVQMEARSANSRPRWDLYEAEKAQTASPGIYQVEKDGEQGYRFSFRPYSE